MEAQPKSNLVHFIIKIWQLVATRSFTDFAENQLACVPENISVQNTIHVFDPPGKVLDRPGPRLPVLALLVAPASHVTFSDVLVCCCHSAMYVQ